MAIWTAKSEGGRHWIVFDQTNDNLTTFEVARKADALAAAAVLNQFEKNYNGLLKTHNKLLKEVKDLRKLLKPDASIALDDAATEVQMS